MKRRTIKKQIRRAHREHFKTAKAYALPVLKKMYRKVATLKDVGNLISIKAREWGMTDYSSAFISAFIAIANYSPRKFPRWTIERRNLRPDNRKEDTV